MKIWGVLAVLAVAAVEVFGQTEFKDGGTHNITTIINNDVWVDYEAPNMQTTVNLLSGKISQPYRFKGYNESRLNISGGTAYWLDAYNNSQVAISGGELNRLWAYDDSNVDISNGKVSFLYTVDNSSVEISGGQIGGGISAYDSSSVHISGSSSTNTFSAFGSSAVNISGGSVFNLSTSNSSTVRISDGVVGELYVYNMRRGSERVNISGGNVGKLQAQIILEGNEQFGLTDDLSVSDLAPFGVQAVEGSIANVGLYQMSTCANSTANISGSSMYSLFAQDSSTVNISGGSMYSLEANNSSIVNISGGSITGELAMGGGLRADDSSTVNISGGSMYVLTAFQNSTVNISGGEVDELRAFAESTLTIVGFDFELAGGLVWADDGQTILEGTGILTGKWFGETESWMIAITQNDASATIMVIPEPTSAAIMILGASLIATKRR